MGQVPIDLGNLLDLWYLAVGRNNLGSNSSMDLDFLTSLKNCTKLEIFEFSSKNFGGSLPNSIRNLSMQLSALYLDGNQLSGIIPAALENFINLTVHWQHSRLFYEVPKAGRIGLSGHIPSSIGNLT